MCVNALLHICLLHYFYLFIYLFNVYKCFISVLSVPIVDECESFITLRFVHPVFDVYECFQGCLFLHQCLISVALS